MWHSNIGELKPSIEEANPFVRHTGRSVEKIEPSIFASSLYNVQSSKSSSSQTHSPENVEEQLELEVQLEKVAAKKQLIAFQLELKQKLAKLKKT